MFSKENCFRFVLLKQNSTTRFWNRRSFFLQVRIGFTQDVCHWLNSVNRLAQFSPWRHCWSTVGLSLLLKASLEALCLASNCQGFGSWWYSLNSWLLIESALNLLTSCPEDERTPLPHIDRRMALRWQRFSQKKWVTSTHAPTRMRWCTVVPYCLCGLGWSFRS